jgi:hypothetical protein
MFRPWPLAVGELDATSRVYAYDGGPLHQPQMATTETRQYRGYKIVPMRQWASWCAEAFPTRADLPFLTQFPLRTLAPSKEAAVAEVKQSIDRILASVERRH